MAMQITDQNAPELIAGDKLVVIDFSAAWCGPCQKMSPIIDAVAEKFDGQVIVGKCDVDESEELAMEFKIRNIPVIAFVKGGEIKHKFVGLTSQADIEAKIEELK